MVGVAPTICLRFVSTPTWRVSSLSLVSFFFPSIYTACDPMSLVVAGGARTPWCQRPFPSLGGWVRLGRVVERSVVSRSMEEKGPLPLPLRYAIENGWKGPRVEPKETKRWMPSNEEDGGRITDACAGKGQRTRRRKRCRKRSNLKSMDDQQKEDGSVVGRRNRRNEKGRSWYRSMVRSTGSGASAYARALRRCGRRGSRVQWKWQCRWN